MRKNAEIATKLVISYLEAEKIMVGTPEIKEKVNLWEDRLDPIDSLSLAAVVLFNPTEIILSQSDIRRIKETFFPSNNFTYNKGGFNEDFFR